MSEKEKNNMDPELDWEYMDGFYDDKREEKKLSLEDFITESDVESNEENTTNEELRKTIEHVRMVRELLQSGRDIDGIVSDTQLSKEYVMLILMTMQGNTEDASDIAVAHMVMLG